MSKIDLYSSEWCELIFEGRNKKYGAYDMRSQTEKRHRYAILLIAAFFVALVAIPSLIKSILPERREQNLDVTTLTQINVEPVDKKKKDRPVNLPPPDEPIPELKASIKNVPPVIKPDEEVPADNEGLKSQDELMNSKAILSIADVQGTDAGVDVKTLSESQRLNMDVEQILVVVDEMPEFPGGQAALLAFLNKNLKYPDLARDNGITGRVVLNFVVGLDGGISNITITRSLDPDCDAEAVRVVKMMPKWKVGKQNGNPVKVQFSLPISFKFRS